MLPLTPAAAGLNPLHCGAVVASNDPDLQGVRLSMSQSPSLRGSGRFEALREDFAKTYNRLNPLHCGAVVASRHRNAVGSGSSKSQSPSLRGSGRFKDNVGF